MKTKLFGFSIFSILLLSLTPAFADVTSVDLEKPVFTDDESIVFTGKESVGGQSVFVIIRTSSGDFVDMASDPVSDPDGTLLKLHRLLFVHQ